MEALKQWLQALIAPKIIISLLVVLVAFGLWIAVRKLLKRYAASNEQTAHGKKKANMMKAMRTIVKFLFVFITVLAVLQINGINVSSMIAGLGIASAVVGLAVQDLLKDVIMGVNILADHFFAVGDVVRYKDLEGIVIAFNLRSTKIQDLNQGNILTISNRNISEMTKVSRAVDLNIPLSYEESPEKVQQALECICGEIAQIPEIEQCDYKGVKRFEDSAVIYGIRFLCPPERKLALRLAAMQILQQGLKKAQLSIPYPQMDVHFSKK